MNARTLLCLHGYGVRGFFWDPVRPLFSESFQEILTPDLRMTDTETLVASTKALVLDKAGLDHEPVVLLGHSLGGVVAALCARDLGPRVVEKVVIMATPYGEREHVPGGVMRLLLRFRLIPDFLVKPRFFSPKTPPEQQKALFERAVPESPALQKELFQARWFHTDRLTHPLEQPTLVFCSQHDRIVPATKTKQLADVLGAETVEFALNQRVAHNDFVWAPEVARRVVTRTVEFLRRT